jgi:peroxiredoxin
LIELEALCEIIDPLEDAGATLVTITPQQSEFSKRLIKDRNLNYDMLTDSKNTYAKKLGLKFFLPPKIIEIYSANSIDIPGANGEDSLSLPIPGRLVIDQQGVARSSSFEPDYTHRPEPEITLETVRKIRSNS